MNGSAAVLLSLEASILRRPPGNATAKPVCLGGVELSSLEDLALTRDNLFDLRFEDVQAELSRQPRMDVEPDGFFVQTGEQGGRLWRLQGHLFELNERLWRLDVAGECPPVALDTVLHAVGWPHTELVFQLVRHGVTLGESDFRRWIAAISARMLRS